MTTRLEILVWAPALCVVIGVSVPSRASAGEPVFEAPSTPTLISTDVEAESCEWPTTVGLFDEGGFSLCSGSLIHPEIVATASHCFESDFSYPTEIVFGENMNAPERTVATEYCLDHPGYVSGSGEDRKYDYAFCKLAEPVYDMPITPPLYGCETDILTPNRAVVISGFGRTYYEDAGIKHWAQTIIQGIDEELELLIVGEGSTTACPGDSGGPVYTRFPDGSWRTAGLLSGGLWAPNTNDCGNEPDSYVMLHDAVPWIEENSGVDVTPCHDVDGTWNPGPGCGGFAVDPLEPMTSWGQWCASERSGPSATCGPDFTELIPDEVAPTVELLTPETGTIFEGPAAMTDVLIEAQDEGHGIREVRLEINGDFVAADDLPPYEFENLGFGQGGWILVAVAEDWNGNIGESEPTLIAVDAPLPEPPPEPPADEGTGGDEVGVDGEAEGCACSSEGAGGFPAWAWIGIFGALGAGRRRGRARPS